MIATMSQDFPSVPHATGLLQAMQNSPNNCVSHYPRNGPSASVAVFLDRIEQTDPSSPEISEDNTNESWGHYQYTASSLTCRTVLTSWASIGNTGIACRLIAGAIRICKVARHLCFSRNIEPTSYLSDIYLANIIELLWDLWTKAFSNPVDNVPSNGQRGNPADPEVTSPDILNGLKPAGGSTLVQGAGAASVADSSLSSSPDSASSSSAPSNVSNYHLNTSRPTKLIFRQANPVNTCTREMMQVLTKEELKDLMKIKNITAPGIRGRSTKEGERLILSPKILYC